MVVANEHAEACRWLAREAGCHLFNSRINYIGPDEWTGSLVAWVDSNTVWMGARGITGSNGLLATEEVFDIAIEGQRLSQDIVDRISAVKGLERVWLIGIPDGKASSVDQLARVRGLRYLVLVGPWVTSDVLESIPRDRFDIVWVISHECTDAQCADWQSTSRHTKLLASRALAVHRQVSDNSLRISFYVIEKE